MPLAQWMRSCSTGKGAIRLDLHGFQRVRGLLGETCGDTVLDGLDDLVFDQLFVDDRAIDREKCAVHAAHGMPGEQAVAEQHLVDVLSVAPDGP